MNAIRWAMWLPFKAIILAMVLVSWQCERVRGQESGSVSATEILRRLEVRAEGFRSYGVKYAGSEVFTKGSQNLNLMMNSMEDAPGENPEDVPAEDAVRDASVEWMVLRDEKMSVIEIETSIMDLAEKQFVPSQCRSYYSGMGDSVLWKYQSKEGNQISLRPIKENTPEYYEGGSVEMDGNHAGNFARALYLSIGAVDATTGDVMGDSVVSPKSITDIRQLTETEIAFAVSYPASTIQANFTCELRDDDSARVRHCVFLFSGEPLFEISLTYNAQDIADTIAAATFINGKISSQVDLALQAGSVSRDVSREMVTFPGVPTDGVILTLDGKYFYIDPNGSRVEFDPRIERKSQGFNRGFYLVAVVFVVVSFTAWIVYRRYKL